MWFIKADFYPCRAEPFSDHSAPYFKPQSKKLDVNQIHKKEPFPVSAA